MSGGILWKALLSLAVVLWAVSNLVPIRDIPFDEYIVDTASAHEDEFDALVAEASSAAEAGQYPSVFVALREMATERSIDLVRYFPDIGLIDIPNQERRNETLLRVLLNDSKSNLRPGLDFEEGIAFTLQLSPEATEGLSRFEKEEQLKQVVEVMERRVNGLGVTEPQIRPVSDDAVEIQLPGMNLREDPEGIEALRKPARLEFRIQRGA